MACRSSGCKYREWCEVKSDGERDPTRCYELRMIARWWQDKISGRRDPEPEEEPEEEVDE